MIFKRINRDQVESVFVVIQNDEGSTMPKDAVAQMEVGTGADGIKAVQPNTGELWAFQGVVDAAIANGDYGLVQVYGYRSTSICFQTGTTQAAGLPVVPTAAQNYLASVATSITYASNTTVSITQQPYMAALAESIDSSSASATISAKVFLRCL